MPNILCIDDEPAVGVVLENTLAELGHQTTLVTSVQEGLRAIASQPHDLVISDYRMPDSTGIELIEMLREQGYEVPVIITTDYASVEHAVLSMRHGAIDYLTKPLRAESLRIAVNNAVELVRLRRQNEIVQSELDQLRARTIVGSSQAVRAVLEMIAAVAPTRATVLLEGESGTGKELFARAIHDQSPRREQPFVTVNCAAMPEGLVESTLFGHERGAFTGATARAQGAFERAHHGTLLLDEISEMRLDLQSKLLRAIQEQEFERVGGHHPIKVDVRLLATTNRDLAAEVEAGRFRRDLYYRLHVVPVRTPPLREHPEDIPELVEHFVRHFASQLAVKPPAVPAATLEALQRRPWRGNVRELANAVERAVILNRGELGPEAFEIAGVGNAAGNAALTVRGVNANSAIGVASGAGNAPAALTEGAAAPAVTLETSAAPTAGEAIHNLKLLERQAIERALVATGGHRAKAARLLGISERTLRNKLNGPGASD